MASPKKPPTPASVRKLARERALELVARLPVIAEMSDGDRPPAERWLDGLEGLVREELDGAGERHPEHGEDLLAEARGLWERIQAHNIRRLRSCGDVGTKTVEDGSIVPADETDSERYLRVAFGRPVFPTAKQTAEQAPRARKAPVERRALCEALAGPHRRRVGWWPDLPTVQDLALVCIIAGASQADGNDDAHVIANEGKAIALAFKDMVKRWEADGWLLSPRRGWLNPQLAKRVKEGVDDLLDGALGGGQWAPVGVERDLAVRSPAT